MRRLPLEGLRIIELCEVWAGPMGCSLLGDLGAEVIKVESYPRASMTRAVRARAIARGYAGAPDGPRPWDRSSTHNMANRNKLHITLNLQSPEGRDLLFRLAEISDAVVDGYSAGTMDRLGCGYEALARVKPDIVMLSMPGWGVRGPYASYVTLGSGLDATSGHWSLRGYPGEDPTRTASVFHTDATGANAIVLAVLTALHNRRRTGRGQWIDMSQAEVFMAHLARPYMDFAMNGRVQGQLGNGDYAMSPHGVFPCAGEDSWIAIAVDGDDAWAALCSVMGDPDWSREERFSDAIERYRNRSELHELIGRWTEAQDADALMLRLQGVGVAASVVANEPRAAGDVHLRERGFFETFEHPLVGPLTQPGPLWQLSDVRLSIRQYPGMLGEHNQQVLGGLLGLSDDELRALAAKQVVGDTYSPEWEIDPEDRARVQRAG